MDKFVVVLNNCGEFVVHTHHLLVADRILDPLFCQRECVCVDRSTRSLALRREDRTDFREAR